MSKLYVVVQVNYEKRFDYKYQEIRTTMQPCTPFIFDRYDRANKEAEKKRKVGVPAFVSEFPFNPLDKKLDTLRAKVDADAEYIGSLESDIGRLEAENAKLRKLAVDVYERLDQTDLCHICPDKEECGYDALDRCTMRDDLKGDMRDLGIEVS